MLCSDRLLMFAKMLGKNSAEAFRVIHSNTLDKGVEQREWTLEGNADLEYALQCRVGESVLYSLLSLA